MASLRKEPRKRRDGTPYWTVTWRAGGVQKGQSWETEALARRFRAYVEAENGNRAKALGHMAAAQDRTEDVPTLDVWMARHIGSLTGVTEGTRHNYAQLHARTWSPRIGHVPLDALGREHIAGAVNDLATHLSAKSVANAHGLLSTALSAAVRDEMILRNPCKGMRLPRADHDAKEPAFLTQDDFARLLAAIREPYRPLVMMLAGTGMRWGEATALPVGAVTLGQPATVHVSRAWKKLARGYELGPPKTKRSKRTVALPAEVVDVIRPLMTSRAKTDLLFTMPGSDEPIRQPHFWRQVWKPALDEARLEPRPRIHDLRHSHVAWLIAAGVPLPVIQARLGHEKITTTIDTYGHLMPDLQVAAAAAADAVFRPLAIGQ